MKLLDVKIDTAWVDLATLVEVNVGDKIALYNADAGKSVFYTENEGEPTKDTFKKVLSPNTEVELIIGEQAVYVRGESNKTKLMITKPNEIPEPEPTEPEPVEPGKSES